MPRNEGGVVVAVIGLAGLIVSGVVHLVNVVTEKKKVQDAPDEQSRNVSGFKQ